MAYNPSKFAEMKSWYVMRDLKRSNANVKAWQILSELGFEVFTPMHWKILDRGGRKIRKFQPVISDLLFVHTDRDHLDPIVKKVDTLQYRILKNNNSSPMIVRDADMQQFIKAVNCSSSIKYYSPSEVSSLHIGKHIRIIGGCLDGFEGKLLTTRGSKIKRLIIELPGLLVAGIEVNPEFIEILDSPL